MSGEGWSASWYELRAGKGCGIGNALPHLHAHIVTRYADDPVPAGGRLADGDGCEACRRG